MTLYQKIKNGFLRFQAKIHHIKKQRHEHEQIPAPFPAPEYPNALHEEEKQHVVMDIPAMTVVRTTVIILLFWVLFNFINQISSILILFFVSFLFAAALDPLVGSLQKKKIPRSVSVLVIYLIIFVLFGVLLANLVPIIAEQALSIGQDVGSFVEHISKNGGSNLPFFELFQPYFQQFYEAVDLSAAAGQLQTTLQALATQLKNISIGLLNVILVLVLTFFMTVEEKSLERFYISLFPSRYNQYISSRLETIKQKVGYWLRGQILVSFIAIILSYIGLIIFNVHYALTLAILSGIFMIIPGIGRMFALIFSLPIIYNQSPTLALWVSIYYIVIQQIELNVIIPYIMNRAVGLSPIIIIFATLVGYQYLDVLGLVLSIPIATMVAIFVKDYLERVKN